MQNYWCANFYSGVGSSERIQYGIKHELWLMQYQYGSEEDDGAVTRNWNVAKKIGPGDWLVAYLSTDKQNASPPKIFSVGRVVEPRLVANHNSSVELIVSGKQHPFSEGIVRYNDAPAFYENLSAEAIPGERVGRWGQRIDVEKWLFKNLAGIPMPQGFQESVKDAGGFIQNALVPITYDYFERISQALKKAANRLEVVLADARRGSRCNPPNNSSRASGNR